MTTISAIPDTNQGDNEQPVPHRNDWTTVTVLDPSFGDDAKGILGFLRSANLFANRSVDHNPNPQSSMASQQPNHYRDLAEHVQDRLGQHREVLEAVAALDNELSADAERALAILDELEGQE